MASKGSGTAYRVLGFVVWKTVMRSVRRDASDARAAPAPAPGRVAGALVAAGAAAATWSRRCRRGSSPQRHPVVGWACCDGCGKRSPRRGESPTQRCPQRLRLCSNVRSYLEPRCSPPDSDPAILAQRRAKRAEIAEEQLQDQLAQARREIDRLQGRADALSGELEMARDRRDQMAGEIDGLNRDLRYSHQREHSERQLRIETQDDLAQARRDATGAHEELRAQLREAHQRAEEFERELSQRRRDADHALGLIERHEAARAKAEAAAHGADEMRAELDRRDALQTEFAEQLQALRDELDALRERHATDAARQTIAQQALHDVMAAAARMRERLEQAQLLRAEAQERLTLTREQLDERDEQLARANARAQRGDGDGRLAASAAALRARAPARSRATDTAVRIQLGDQAAIYDEIRQLAGMVADVVVLAAGVRSSYER